MGVCRDYRWCGGRLRRIHPPEERRALIRRRSRTNVSYPHVWPAFRTNTQGRLPMVDAAVGMWAFRRHPSRCALQSSGRAAELTQRAVGRFRPILANQTRSRQPRHVRMRAGVAADMLTSVYSKFALRGGEYKNLSIPVGALSSLPFNLATSRVVQLVFPLSRVR